MGEEIESLAKFVAETRWEDVPEGVRQHAKLVLLDTLGVILAGSARPEVAELRQRLTASRGAGATVYANGWPEADPRTAALLNGIAGRSIELCEGLRFVSGQAAMQVLPGVLAVGEHANSSGRDMLTALVLGYDVVARIAGGFTPRPLAHQNGQVSLLAAAAAGARLRGLDAAGISSAMRIATVLMLTPSYTNAVAGATALNVAGGMSGFAAALAPELALAGFAAQPNAIEETLANLIGDGFVPDRVLDELGSVWHITRNYFRLYACCNPIHPALDCLAAALAELHPRPDQIERIEVATYRFASVMKNPQPAELFRLEIFAAACRRRDGGARRCRVCSTRRYGTGRSGHRGIAPKGPYQRGPGDERSGAAAAAGARDADANRWPAEHQVLRQSSRRFSRAVQRCGDPRQIPGIGRNRTDRRRRRERSSAPSIIARAGPISAR